MFPLKRLTLACLAAAMLDAPAQATEYLTGSFGWYDLIDQDNEALHFGLEYRYEPWWAGLGPMAGGSVTSDGALYGYAGLNWSIAVSPGVYVAPNFAAGVYGNGDGKDLGSAVEFRSGIEFDYEMPNYHRLGLAFNHLSNAGIGDKNPGTETLMVTYSLPFGGH